MIGAAALAQAVAAAEPDALVRFIAPAKDAGNATLKLHRDTWVFNPRLNQVIKLPASMMTTSSPKRRSSTRI
jgi:hypothetical protein